MASSAVVFLVRKGPLGCCAKITNFTRDSLERSFFPGDFEGAKSGEAFLLAVGAFLLTVELLCLQSIEVPIRLTFPL